LERLVELIQCSELLLVYKIIQIFGMFIKIPCIRKVKEFLMNLRSYSTAFVLNGLRKDGPFSKLEKAGGITKE